MSFKNTTDVGSRTQIARQNVGPRNVDVTATESTTEEIEFLNFSGGSFEVPSNSNVTTITFYASLAEGATHVPLYDSNGLAVTLTVAAGKIYDLPSALFGVPYFKLMSNATGIVRVFLKG